MPQAIGKQGAHSSLARYLRDPTLRYSPARWARGRRLRLFLKMLEQVPGKVEVLDVGGTVAFWEESEIALDERVSIVVANLVVDPTQPRTRAISAIQADARDLSMFPDARFDVVFSNSVVEHLIGFSDREAMAKEIRRVGRRYLVQPRTGTSSSSLTSGSRSFSSCRSRFVPGCCSILRLRGPARSRSGTRLSAWRLGWSSSEPPSCERCFQVVPCSASASPG